MNKYDEVVTKTVAAGGSIKGVSKKTMSLFVDHVRIHVLKPRG